MAWGYPTPQEGRAVPIKSIKPVKQAELFLGLGTWKKLGGWKIGEHIDMLASNAMLFINSFYLPTF
jgi:hypothetical protein